MNEGKLSQLQLEGVLYACTKHQELLPSGQRMPCSLQSQCNCICSRNSMPLHTQTAVPYQSFRGARRSVLTINCSCNCRCWLLHWGWGGCRKGPTDSRHYLGQLCERQTSSCVAVNFHREPLPRVHASSISCMHHYRHFNKAFVIGTNMPCRICTMMPRGI